MGRLTVTEQINQKYQEDLQRLRGLRLLDDDFLTKCFEEDAPVGKLMHDFSCTGSITLEKIAEFVDLSVDEVKKLKTSLSMNIDCSRHVFYNQVYSETVEEEYGALKRLLFRRMRYRWSANLCHLSRKV